MTRGELSVVLGLPRVLALKKKGVGVMAERRVLFLDVDDTFLFFGEWVVEYLPSGFSSEPRFTVEEAEWVVEVGRGMGVAYRSDLPLMVQALAWEFEIVWCTSWGEELANAFWGPRLGVGSFGSVVLRGSRVQAINEWLREQPDVVSAVWVDALVRVVVPGDGGVDWALVRSLVCS